MVADTEDNRHTLSQPTCLCEKGIDQFQQYVTSISSSLDAQLILKRGLLGIPLLQEVAVHGVPAFVMLPCGRGVKVIRWGRPWAQQRVATPMKFCPFQQPCIQLKQLGKKLICNCMLAASVSCILLCAFMLEMQNTACCVMVCQPFSVIVASAGYTEVCMQRVTAQPFTAHWTASF